MRRPAASPGRLHEALGNERPREMAATTRVGGTEPGLQACSPILTSTRSLRPTRVHEVTLPYRLESLEPIGPPLDDAIWRFAVHEGSPHRVRAPHEVERRSSPARRELEPARMEAL